MKRLALAFAILIAAASPLVSADTLLVASGTGNPVPFSNVKVSKVDGGKIYFRTQSGMETSRDFEQVVKMQIDDEPGFNAAEEAYAAKQWQPALDGYQKALRASDKGWLKDRSAARLADTAAKANRLDLAISAYIYLLSRDGKSAVAARPAINEGAAGLDAAAVEINKGLQDSKLTDEKRSALLSLLLDVHRARKDATAQGETIEQLQKYNVNLGNDPAANRTMADLTLSIAKSALEQKKYAKVLADIEAKKSVFQDPAQQVEALFLIAEAKNGIDGESKDPNKLKDIALAYMRVVAAAKDAPNAPQVPAALYNTALIMEKLAQRTEALRLYKDIAKSDNSFTGKAKEAVERLGKESK